MMTKHTILLVLLAALSAQLVYSQTPCASHSDCSPTGAILCDFTTGFCQGSTPPPPPSPVGCASHSACSADGSLICDFATGNCVSGTPPPPPPPVPPPQAPQPPPVAPPPSEVIVLQETSGFLGDSENYNVFMFDGLSTTSSEIGGDTAVFGTVQLNSVDLGTFSDSDVVLSVDGLLMVNGDTTSSGILEFSNPISSYLINTEADQQLEFQFNPLPGDINFAEQASVIEEVQFEVADQSNTVDLGTVTLDSDSLLLTGGSEISNTFDLESSDFDGISLIELDVPQESSVVVNVDGATVSLSDINVTRFDSTLDGRNVPRVISSISTTLFNFHNAFMVNLLSTILPGTVLAETANIWLTQGSGVLGTLVAGRALGTTGRASDGTGGGAAGSSGFQFAPYQGVDPTCEIECDNPAWEFYNESVPDYNLVACKCICLDNADTCSLLPATPNFNASSCSCYCGITECPPDKPTFDSATCSCKCRLSPSRCTSASKPFFNAPTCSCICPITQQDCPPNFTFNAPTCSCICTKTEQDCEGNYELNEETCSCDCGLDPQECSGATPDFDEQTCSCTCNALPEECDGSTPVFDTETCSCICDIDQAFCDEFVGRRDLTKIRYSHDKRITVSEGYPFGAEFDTNRLNPSAAIPDHGPGGPSPGQPGTMSGNFDDGTAPQFFFSSGHTFPFFGQGDFTSIFVNINGVLSFGQAVSTFTPNPFPLEGNNLFITPYWADIDLRGPGPNNIWYREDLSAPHLGRISTEIQQTFPETHPTFAASWSFVATWDNVGYYNSHSDLQNSIQVVLATDGSVAFVIFNYFDVQWTTGDASGGSGGSGGTPAQAGFNSPSGDYFSVPTSLTAGIVNIDGTSNVGRPGVWIFKVNGEIELPPPPPPPEQQDYDFDPETCSCVPA